MAHAQTGSGDVEKGKRIDGGSYQRGMQWADCLLSNATLFSNAFSGGLHAASGGLGMPLAVQQRLDQQQALLEAHADLSHSLVLEVGTSRLASLPFPQQLLR